MTDSPVQYGSVTFQRHDDGRVTVVEADDIIGIDMALLGDPESRLWADPDGTLRLPHDGPEDYLYRPVRVAPAWGAQHGWARVLICERVR